MSPSASFCKVISLSALLLFPVMAAAFPQDQTPATRPPPASTDKADKKGVASPSPSSAAAAAGAPVDSGSYKIRPADILLIRGWNEAEFSGPVAVHQDGKFTLPLVGDLQAGGKTPIEVQDIISDALKKYVVKPL